MGDKLVCDIYKNELKLLALDISQEVIAEFAPEEIEHFDQLVDGHKHDESDQYPLAMGVEELFPVISPIVFGAVTAALGYMVKRIFDMSIEIARDEIKIWLNRRREKKKTLI